MGEPPRAIAAAHRHRSLGAIDPSPQATQTKSSIWSEPSGLKATSPIGLVGQPFGLTVPVESKIQAGHRRVALPKAKLPQAPRCISHISTFEATTFCPIDPRAKKSAFWGYNEVFEVVLFDLKNVAYL